MEPEEMQDSLSDEEELLPDLVDSDDEDHDDMPERVVCPGCEQEVDLQTLERHKIRFLKGGEWTPHFRDLSTFPFRLYECENGTND